VETEAPAASWGSGTVPSTQPSSGEQQQEETQPQVPSDTHNCIGADEDNITNMAGEGTNTCAPDAESNTTTTAEEGTNNCAPDAEAPDTAAEEPHHTPGHRSKHHPHLLQPHQLQQQR
jgi:hypothetical protein